MRLSKGYAAGAVLSECVFAFSAWLTLWSSSADRKGFTPEAANVEIVVNQGRPVLHIASHKFAAIFSAALQGFWE
jgi:hypothetical protein